MGGLGSGRWGWYRRKTRVEECAVLDLDAWVTAGLLDNRTGHVEWTSTEGGTGNSLSYRLSPTDVPDCKYLYIFYSDGKGGLESEPVTLLSKPQRFGGVRWCFFCPRWCKRWVRKLYLPPGKSLFGC